MPVANETQTWIGPRRLPLTPRLAMAGAEMAGAENVAPTEQAPAVDLEEIARIDPDALLIFATLGPFTPADMSMRSPNGGCCARAGPAGCS